MILFETKHFRYRVLLKNLSENQNFLFENNFPFWTQCWRRCVLWLTSVVSLIDVTEFLAFSGVHCVPVRIHRQVAPYQGGDKSPWHSAASLIDRKMVIKRGWSGLPTPLTADGYRNRISVGLNRKQLGIFREKHTNCWKFRELSWKSLCQQQFLPVSSISIFNTHW